MCQTDLTSRAARRQARRARRPTARREPRRRYPARAPDLARQPGAVLRGPPLSRFGAERRVHAPHGGPGAALCPGRFRRHEAAGHAACRPACSELYISMGSEGARRRSGPRARRAVPHHLRPAVRPQRAGAGDGGVHQPGLARLRQRLGAVLAVRPASARLLQCYASATCPKCLAFAGAERVGARRRPAGWRRAPSGPPTAWAPR